MLIRLILVYKAGFSENFMHLVTSHILPPPSMLHNGHIMDHWFFNQRSEAHSHRSVTELAGL